MNRTQQLTAGDESLYAAAHSGMEAAQAVHEAGHPQDALASLARTRTIVDGLIEHTVSEARAAGVPWSYIGIMLGISKQAAQQRYGR